MLLYASRSAGAELSKLERQYMAQVGGCSVCTPSVSGVRCGKVVCHDGNQVVVRGN